MEELLIAIENIKYRTSKFPKEGFQIITAYKEEAIPYLREAIQKAIDERYELDEENRKRAYLMLAFSEFVKKVEGEKINSFAEYDEKCSIHYLCEDWMSILLSLLEDSGDESSYAEVAMCFRNMGMN